MFANPRTLRILNKCSDQNKDEMEKSDNASDAHEDMSLSSEESIDAYLVNISDAEDPTYSPRREKQMQKQVPDYFKVKTITTTKENVDTLFASEPSDFTVVTEPSQFLTIPQNSNKIVGQSRLSANNKFLKCPYLDGKFFKVTDFIEKQNKITAECQICLPKKTFIKGSLGVSTNFLKHMKKIHNNKMEEYTQHKLTLKTESQIRENKRKDVMPQGDNNTSKKRRQLQTKITQQFKKEGEGVLDQQNFNKKLLHFITDTMSAVSILDKPSFISLFDGTNLKVMSRFTAMKKISDLCIEIMASIKMEIECTEYVCTTADIWSAKRRSFFGLTCHWVDKNYKRRSVALACKRFVGNHTYDKISEILEDIHSKFNLNTDKIVATITDNGSNFVKAFGEFGGYKSNDMMMISDSEDEELEDSENDNEIVFLELENRFQLPKHIRCAAHTLNLIATTDVKNIIDKNTSLRTRHTNSLAKCSVLWKMARRPKSAEIIQEVLGHTLSYPGATRWNSLYDAISQIIKEKEKLPTLFEKLGTKNQSSKESEIQYLTEYCMILKPLATALDILQGETNMFYGYLMPCLGSLLTKFNKLEKEKISVAKLILDACKSGLLKRFNAFFDLSTTEAMEASIASFSLPQFKLRWLSNFKDFVDVSVMNDQIVKQVADVAQKHMNFDAGENNDRQETATEEQFFEFEENIPGTSATYMKASDKKRIELEILQYLNDSETQLASLDKYATVKTVFYRFNTCLASSAPVERLFSFAEIINAPRRNALTDGNFENLVLLKANGNR